MKEIFFSLLLIGILRGMERIGIGSCHFNRGKIIDLVEYRKRRAAGAVLTY